MSQWTDEELMAVADELLDELPEDIKHGLEGVSILIQDLPTADQARRVGLRQGATLLGLYEGVPLSRGSVFQSAVLPPAIYLFRRNIERVCRTPEELKERLRFTLFHEIGHHLGFTEEDLRKRGL
jgi:predicted Zn-dependent protease with MMP-like domain